MKNPKNFYWGSLAIIGCIILIVFDQWTKRRAIVHLMGQKDIELIPGILRLHYLENRGAAFGILQNQQWFFVILGIVFLVAAAYVFSRMPKEKHYIALGTVITVLAAGAVGNIVDRVMNRYVIDFIYVSLINFPIFNVADIYVTVSAVALILLILFFYKDEDFSFLSRKK